MYNRINRVKVWKEKKRMTTEETKKNRRIREDTRKRRRTRKDPKKVEGRSELEMDSILLHIKCECC